MSTPVKMFPLQRARRAPFAAYVTGVAIIQGTETTQVTSIGSYANRPDRLAIARELERNAKRNERNYRQW